jgi:hypothetical protein
MKAAAPTTLADVLATYARETVRALVSDDTRTMHLTPKPERPEAQS